MVKNRIEELSKENLKNIVLKMTEFLSEEQCEALEMMIDACITAGTESEKEYRVQRMSQELVDEKMEQLEGWKRQIDEGEPMSFS